MQRLSSIPQMCVFLHVIPKNLDWRLPKKRSEQNFWLAVCAVNRDRHAFVELLQFKEYYYDESISKVWNADQIAME
jgi:hypothetical protein